MRIKLFTGILLAFSLLQPLKSISQSMSRLMDLMHQNMSDVQKVEMTTDPDIDFANIMKVHHEGAIKMSDEEIAKGKDEALKKKARQMKMDQQKEIDELNSFLSTHKPLNKSESAHKKLMSAMDKMGQGMDMSGGKSIDKEFTSLMTQHHKDGIMMIDKYLAVGKDSKLLAMMKKSKAKQQEDIAVMSKLSSTIK